MIVEGEVVTKELHAVKNVTFENTPYQVSFHTNGTATIVGQGNIAFEADLNSSLIPIRVAIYQREHPETARKWKAQTNPAFEVRYAVEAEEPTMPQSLIAKSLETIYSTLVEAVDKITILDKEGKEYVLSRIKDAAKELDCEKYVEAAIAGPAR